MAATRPAGERDFGLDAMRAAAILAVLCLHVARLGFVVPASVNSVCSRGWAGVDLFFVLSGFLIGGQLLRSHAVGEARLVGPFWVRRWTRTLPLYFTALFVYAVLKPYAFHAPFQGGFRWTYLVFLQDLFGLTDFGQSWSLCVEEQFYFLFPLVFVALAAVSPRVARSKWIWLAPLVVSVLARGVRLHDMSTKPMLPWDAFLYAEGHIRCTTITHLDGLAVGVFLAATRDTWSAWSRSARIRLALAGACASLAALAAVGTAPAGPDLLWLYTVLAFGFGAVLVGSHGAPAPRLGAAWIRWVALLSYGGYLWNNLIARLFERSWRGPWALGALVFVAATFAVAWVTYTCVELPGMRLRRPLLSWLGADRDRFEGTRASDRPAVDPSSSS